MFKKQDCLSRDRNLDGCIRKRQTAENICVGMLAAWPVLNDIVICTQSQGLPLHTGGSHRGHSPCLLKEMTEWLMV